MRIRPATENEAGRLTRLALSAKASWGYPDELLVAWRRELTVTPATIREQPTCVAVEAGAIVGFYSLRPASGAWCLQHLWIAPRHMRKGIGRALLAHALDTARRGGASEVTVDAEPHAEPFYLTCGATRRGTVAAPVPGDPQRVRPQLVLYCKRQPDQVPIPTR